MYNVQKRTNSFQAPSIYHSCNLTPSSLCNNIVWENNCCVHSYILLWTFKYHAGHSLSKRLRTFVYNFFSMLKYVKAIRWSLTLIRVSLLPIELLCCSTIYIWKELVAEFFYLFFFIEVQIDKLWKTYLNNLLFRSGMFLPPMIYLSCLTSCCGI